MGIASNRSNPTSVEMCEDPRDVIADTIVSHGGVLVKVGHELGLSRNGLRNKIRNYDLWPVVNMARARRLERIKKERENELQQGE